MIYFRAMITGMLCVAASVAIAGEPVTFISGGVGEDERQELEQKENQYNLKLIFTGERGMYLSDVQVIITDKDKNILVDELTEGPFLLAKLPSGRYTLEASVASFKKTVPIRIGAKLRIYDLNFPVKDAPAEIRQYHKPDTIDQSMSSPEGAVEIDDAQAEGAADEDMQEDITQDTELPETVPTE